MKHVQGSTKHETNQEVFNTPYKTHKRLNATLCNFLALNRTFVLRTFVRLGTADTNFFEQMFDFFGSP